MPTLLEKIKAAKPGRCRDCGGDMDGGRAVWSSWCEACEDARKARAMLEGIIAGGDARSIAEALGWLEFVQNDAAVFRSARANECLTRGVLRAVRVAEAEAVRQVRAPIIGGEDDADAVGALFVQAVS